MLHKLSEVYNTIWQYLSYAHLTDYIVPAVIKVCIVLAFFIANRIILRMVIKGTSNFCKRKHINSHTCLLIKKTIRYSINILTIILALQNIGIQITPLVTALGVSGVALSFGMKDTISNIIAGVLIMAYQQFKVGDHIKIKDWQGTVIDINIRYTTLQADDMTVFIPNSVLYSATFGIIQEKEK